MAEHKVSTRALNDVIKLYETLLTGASQVEVEMADGSRAPLDEAKRQAILAAFNSASTALISGCQEGVYGLFVTD